MTAKAKAAEEDGIFGVKNITKFVADLPDSDRAAAQQYTSAMQQLYIRIAQKKFGKMDPPSIQKAAMYVDEISNEIMKAVAIKLFDIRVPEMAAVFGGVIGSAVANAYENPEIDNSKTKLTTKMFRDVGSITGMSALLVALAGIESVKKKKESRIITPVH